MPPAWGRRGEESPESWNKEKKQEDKQEEDGECEQRETWQAQMEEHEKESQVLVQSDSMDHSTIVRPKSQQGLLHDGYCEEEENTQSRQRELLLSLESLDCSAQLLESAQRFLSPTPGS
ncbi:melanopsin-B-like isoform X1 [Lates japonicus]|uniref:Melanopsin-B-like isoform X1 n=1 Tax=Lates japonicus TaxID=270547 RepID=A0AAD3R574_LATJO|nr:melanopsin-B-like isoform X1 [Lates japonicus]